MTTNTETMEDDRIVAKCYVELGEVTKEKGEYDESLRYHRKSMEIFERIDDQLSVADSHLNIAEIYKAKGELKQAMSEYEKGLTLYEDVYVEDTNKNSDSGTDVSLNSSSFSDLQHTKSLSKSDETLPHTTLINTMEKELPLPSPRHSLADAGSMSATSLDLIGSSTRKINEFDSVPHSIDDSFLTPPERMNNERRKSISTSSLCDLQDINANNMFLPFTPREFGYDTTGESTPEESDILEIALPNLPPMQSFKQNISELPVESLSLANKLVDTNNNIDNTRWFCRLSNKQFLIILLSIILTGVLCWLLNINPMQSLLSSSSIDSVIHGKSPDDLDEQLRKILTWRKDRLASLSKDNRRTIEEFLTDSNSRTEITLDKFQKILAILHLKIVLIPQ